MQALIVNTKNKAEFQLVSDMLKKMHIETKVVSDNEPNTVTLKAMKNAEQGKSVTRHESSKDLFNKLGV